MDAIPQFPASELPFRAEIDADEHDAGDSYRLDGILCDHIRRPRVDEGT